MNRALAGAALAAIPALAVLFHLLARSGLPVLSACLAGMAIYWLLLLIGLTRGGWSLRLRMPPRATVALCLIPALGLAVAALPRLLDLSPEVLATVAVAALINGTLEEAFWRGAIIPRLGPGDARKAVLPVLLFTLWHVAPASALVRLEVPGGVVGMMLGPLALGTLAMAARLGSGSAGFGALGHVLVNLATFGVIAASNPSPALA